MELTGVAEAARWEGTRIPECSWEKWLTEATSGLNDGLGRDFDQKIAYFLGPRFYFFHVC
jgi:hypothetical protein